MDRRTLLALPLGTPLLGMAPQAPAGGLEADLSTALAAVRAIDTHEHILPEVEAVCDLPGTRARAELWRLASEWRARPLRVLTGWLWEPA